ncbi:hypothetical protein C7M61_001578 [Candidozyma pseudohaemuli]|uniref:DH domain-containing protein n=1 Tax=Candidozyma pseudohaemuli TaxID=418784 RepID=A0A2P7YUY2_9ASCO|nr:hypothetical protein C7M61_001578 [[Candida] pseudohaemulonii]PSK39773.1 hypothetical protein C7M61_001578 [[Candida] pseudohaemulonii]
MDIYRRYASGEHDEQFFSKNNHSEFIKLRPLLGHFDNLGPNAASKPVLYWQELFPQAAFFAGFDEVLFGYVITVVYKNETTLKISAISITKFGCNIYENLMLDVRLRFWPACENLDPEHRDSNVRKALAIANLKNYNQLFYNTESLHSRWDETNAGALASSMDVLTGRVPVQLGEKLLSLGLLQDHWISSTLMDVVYDSKTPLNGEVTIEENNKLVFALGKQMDQLFDPLLEYSPQAMDYHYNAPRNPQAPLLQNNTQIEKVLNELYDVQANYAMDLIAILQDLVNPLRAKVLSSDSSTGIQKVNLIFPPTIDEVCRINCILHDSLSRARAFGYVEIFQVFENILPYFYKAFVRHEANLRNFHNRLAKFLEVESKLMESTEVNKRKFSARSIEAIVSGCILELPRIKLILKRLYDDINLEKSKLQNFENTEDHEKAVIDKAFNACIEIIDSFGYKEDQGEKPVSNRVFTPSGKLLTEIATEWPVELQYGWINRKVIGVHELKEVIPTPAHSQILIIFSDSVLFLDAFESENKTSILVPSILMNSLINQKPLPKLSQFPLLKVKFWCSIADVLVKGYSRGEDTFLSFMAFGESGFRDRNGHQLNPMQNFQVMDSTEETLMASLQKAKVLHKVTSFHLFSDKEENVLRFYSAHERQSYKSELSTSPIVMLLNLNHDEIDRIFQDHSHVFIVLNASFINHHTVHISGHDRSKKYKIEEIVGIGELRASLREILAKSLDVFYHSTFFSEVVTKGNDRSLEYFVERFSKQGVEKELPKVIETKQVEVPPKPVIAKREPSIEKEAESKQEEAKSYLVDTMSEAEPSCGPRLLFKGFFSKFKKSKRVKKSPKVRLTPEQRQEESAKKIPNTENPRGKKQVYDSIYKPTPTLRESSISSTPKRETEQAQRNISVNTGSSSHYTNTSLDVQPNFQFPLDTVDENAEGEVAGTVKYAEDHHHLESKTNDESRKSSLQLSRKLSKYVPRGNDKEETIQPQVLPKANTAPEPPQHRVQNEKKLFNDGEIPMPPKKRIFSSQDIANALEHINAAGISPHTYAKYKKYEELPTSNFYSDGEANWTRVTREDSSNLQREVRAMKEEANMDTLDVIDVGNNGSPLRMIPQKIHYDSSEGTISSNDGINVDLSQETVRATEAEQPLAPYKAFSQLPSEQSTESLNSAQYMSDFGKKLDEGFHLDNLSDQKSLPFTVDTLVVNEDEATVNAAESKETADSQEAAEEDRCSITISSEEYFSPDEYVSALRDEYFGIEPNDMANTVTLSSSEKTLMNVAREVEKEEEDKGFQIKFDSVAYLSDILNGTVKI